MAKKSHGPVSTPEDVKIQQTEAEGSGETERQFLLSVLREKCVALFGCTSSTFDGAFFGRINNATYTVAEAKKIINEWLRKEIK